MEPGSFKVLWDELELAIAHSINALLGHRLAVAEPLRHRERLNDVSRAAAHVSVRVSVKAGGAEGRGGQPALWDNHGVVGVAAEETLLLETFQNKRACSKAVHALQTVRTRQHKATCATHRKLAAIVGHHAILGDDSDHLELVALPALHTRGKRNAQVTWIMWLLQHLVIVLVVCRCDLDGTCSKAHVHKVISKDHNLATHVKHEETMPTDDVCARPVSEGMARLLANKALVALVLGMHGNSNITKHGLGTGCCNNNLAAAIFERIRKRSDDAKLDLNK